MAIGPDEAGARAALAGGVGRAGTGGAKAASLVDGDGGLRKNMSTGPHEHWAV